MPPLILSLPGNDAFADNLSSHLGGEIGRSQVRHFPDGETYVRIDSPVDGREVILIATLERADEKILPLLFMAATARELGAAKVGLIAPYLAYMRQDRRFQEGEGITSAYFAKIISDGVDWLITVDPHLHRRSDLSEIYSIAACSLHAAPLISDWIRQNVSSPVLIGPDAESEQWVKSVAQEAQAPYLVLEKTRRGDRTVEVSVPRVEGWQDHIPVLVDDIISTAHTMIETVTHLKNAAMAPPVCIGVHGVFAGNAYEDLLAAGAGKVVTTNTIPHQSNAIDVSALIAEAARKVRPQVS